MRDSTENSDTPEVLDPETMAAVEAGLRSAENGRRWTLDEAIEFARKRREEWKRFADTAYDHQQGGMSMGN